MTFEMALASIVLCAVRDCTNLVISCPDTHMGNCSQGTPLSTARPSTELVESRTSAPGRYHCAVWMQMLVLHNDWQAVLPKLTELGNGLALVASLDAMLERPAMLTSCSLHPC